MFRSFTCLCHPPTSAPPCLWQLWGLNGFAQGSIFPVMMTILSGHLDKATRGTVLGVWTTSQQLGGVASTAFTGYVLQVAARLPADEYVVHSPST
jgi:sugar phosphate permease